MHGRVKSSIYFTISIILFFKPNIQDFAKILESKEASLVLFLRLNGECHKFSVVAIKGANGVYETHCEYLLFCVLHDPEYGVHANSWSWEPHISLCVDASQLSAATYSYKP